MILDFCVCQACGKMLRPEKQCRCDMIDMAPLELEDVGKLKIRIGKITPLKFDGN